MQCSPEKGQTMWIQNTTRILERGEANQTILPYHVTIQKFKTNKKKDGRSCK